MILITGATGTNGQEVIRQLVAAGHKVRALVRNPAKAESLKGPLVELAQGDFDNAASLDAALAGADHAFFLSTFGARYVGWYRNFEAAAQRAGKPHVVKFSGMGANENAPVEILRLHGQTDRMLCESGLPYTILQPNSFFQNMFWSAGSIKAQGVFYQPMREARQSFVDVRDICAVAMKALTEPGHLGKTYPLTGPEALTCHEVAKQLSAAIGKEVRYVDVTGSAAKDSMLKMGMPEWEASALVELFAYFADGKAAAVTDTIQAVTGKPARSFAQFARDHAAAFKP